MENVEWESSSLKVMFETSGLHLIAITYLINKIQKSMIKIS